MTFKDWMNQEAPGPWIWSLVNQKSKIKNQK